VADYHKHLETINESLAAARAYHASIQVAMDEIQKVGMYPAVPSEQWQRHEGKGQYLYMLFRMNPDGTYQGPDGKRKVSIGADPDKIDDAQRLAENRRRWERLQWDLEHLERWLDLRLLELQGLAERCERWEQTELLGPVSNSPVTGRGPNKG
jgi:hypothetical protein